MKSWDPGRVLIDLLILSHVFKFYQEKMSKKITVISFLNISKQQLVFLLSLKHIFWNQIWKKK